MKDYTHTQTKTLESYNATLSAIVNTIKIMLTKYADSITDDAKTKMLEEAEEFDKDLETVRAELTKRWNLYKP